ncbi:MAG: class B sortase [Lachnospiraceae bacterium]|nr:class B sortase [Lachnospiraceae bacterium]
MSKKKVLSFVMLMAAICVVATGCVMFGGSSEGDEVLSPDEIVQYMPSTDMQQDGTSVSPESAESEPQQSEVAESEPVESQPQDTSSAESTDKAEESKEPEVVLVENPYADYFKQNGDMVAWLSIPGMVIDYPVMQTPENEEYYLRKDFYGKKSNGGCLILDTDSSIDPIGTNLMIHGHNMKAKTMFGTLMEYKDKNFYEEHKYITLTTKEVQKNYEVMAVFYSQVYKKSDKVFKFYKFFQADTEEEFNDFYDNVMDLAVYDTGVTAEFGDNLLTLVTCAYHVDNGRFVVVAKEIEDGDRYLPIE